MIFNKYNHLEVENRIYHYWEKNDLFKPKKNKKKFSIVIPPPTPEPEIIEETKTWLKTNGAVNP